MLPLAWPPRSPNVCSVLLNSSGHQWFSRDCVLSISPDFVPSKLAIPCACRRVGFYRLTSSKQFLSDVAFSPLAPFLGVWFLHLFGSFPPPCFRSPGTIPLPEFGEMGPFLLVFLFPSLPRVFLLVRLSPIPDSGSGHSYQL